jgi:hypothetical protein
LFEIPRRRGFAGLLPPGAERLPVAWHQVQIPGPPQGFALAGAELTATAPLDRFHRRMIQLLDCGPGSRRVAALGHDRLALVDKVSPHALHDLMLSEVSERPKSTPDAVAHRTGRMLWQTGLGFVRFVSDAGVRREFSLDGAQCQLALNCDPNTLDRESVQAAKQFHLHLLCWTPQELTALARPQRLGEIGDARMRRQFLDPLAFLGARLISEALAGLDPAEDPALAGAAWLPDDPAAVFAGRRPLGALLRLPGWQVLGEPGFEALIRRLHRRLDDTARALLDTFTGHREPPEPWHRHPLRPPHAIAKRIDALGFSAEVRAGLHRLAAGLRDLPAASARRLAGATPSARMHCMTLNQPCYGLNLMAYGNIQDNGAGSGHSPGAAEAAAPIDAAEVLLVVQTKLFSGTGGAGLLALNGIPSVRILRGQGAYSARQWQRRAAFQRAFAEHNGAALTSLFGGGCGPVRRLIDFDKGWV